MEVPKVSDDKKLFSILKDIYFSIYLGSYSVRFCHVYQLKLIEDANIKNISNFPQKKTF